MAALPELVLDKIFSFLQSRDLVSARNVCMRWRRVVDQPHIWRKSMFVCINVPSAGYLERHLSEMPFLDTLLVDRESNIQAIAISLGQRLQANLSRHSFVALRSQMLFEDDVLRILNLVCNTNKKLRTLIVKHMRHIPLQLFEKLVLSCSDLEVLDVRDLVYLSEQVELSHFDRSQSLSATGEVSRIHYNSRTPHSSVFAELKNLKKLDVSNLETLSGLSVRKIIDKCVHLEELFICSAVDLGDDDLLYVVENKKQSLLSLSVCGKQLTDASLNALAALEKLKLLKIRCCPNLSESTVQNIGKLNLKSLCITESRDLTRNAMVSLFSQANISNLKHLDLSYVDTLGDDVVALLTATSFHELEDLNIARCGMTDRSLGYIVSGCSQLKYLNISGLYFYSEDSLMLLRRLSHLRILKVHRYRGIVRIVKKLERLLPQLTVQFTTSEFPASLVMSTRHSNPV